MYSVKYEINGKTKTRQFGADDTRAREFYNRIKQVAHVAWLYRGNDWIEMMPQDEE